MILARLSRLQAGDSLARREAARMITEKTTAAAVETFALSAALMSGKTPVSALESTVKSYRRKVAANRRRLAKK